MEELTKVNTMGKQFRIGNLKVLIYSYDDLGRVHMFDFVLEWPRVNLALLVES